MSRMTGAEIADKHQENMRNASARMETGVRRVTKAPGEAAAAKADKMLANLTASVRSGKWAKNTAAVSLPEWQAAMIEKGIPRIDAGVELAKPKTAKFHDALGEHQDRLKVQIDAMPDLTIADSERRMIAHMRGMVEFPGVS